MYRTTHVLCTLTLSLALALPAAAALYRYRTPDGRWVITNTPPPPRANAETYAETGDITANPAPFEAALVEEGPQSPRPSSEGAEALEFGKSTNYERGDFFYVQGLVYNRSRARTMRYLKIIITMYDRFNNLVMIEDSYIDSTHLHPGQQGTYTVMLHKRPGADMARFQTSAQWQWE